MIKLMIIINLLFGALTSVFIESMPIAYRNASKEIKEELQVLAQPILFVKDRSRYHPIFDCMMTTNMIADHIVKVNKNIAYDTAFSYANHIYDAALKWKINPFLITAIIQCESTFNNTSVNKSTGAIGLSQIYWKWHKNALVSSFSSIKKREDLLDPKNSIYAGTWIFWCYLKSSRYSVRGALTRYCSSNKGYPDKVMGIAKRLHDSYIKYSNIKLAKALKNPFVLNDIY